MTDAEWAGWSTANDTMTWPNVRASSPCRDCTLGFAAEMRARDLCDGTPGRRLTGVASHRAKCPCRAHQRITA